MGTSVSPFVWIGFGLDLLGFFILLLFSFPVGIIIMVIGLMFSVVGLVMCILQKGNWVTAVYFLAIDLAFLVYVFIIII